MLPFESLVKQSPEPGQKEVITNDLLACDSADLGKRLAKGTILSDKVDVSRANMIDNAGKPPTSFSTPPRKRLSVTFASPIERVMSPSNQTAVYNMQDSPIEMSLPQRPTRYDSDEKKPYFSYDDPLSPLPEPTTTSTPHKLGRSLFASNSGDYRRKVGSSCE